MHALCTEAETTFLQVGEYERTSDVVDPTLTPVGLEQTATLAAKVQAELQDGMPAPTRVFSSLAWRTCQTTMALWGPPASGVTYEAVHVSAESCQHYM